VSFKLNVINTECHKSVLYAKCHYAECRYAECHYAECRYAECRYIECRYAECRGTSQIARSFIVRAPGACIIKFITAVIYGFRNKLECLPLSSLSSLFKLLWVLLWPYPQTLN